MDIIKDINREELIRIYLKRDCQKENKPDIINILDFNDANQMDNVFSKNGYKNGVITGFKKWSYVKIYKNDLIKCAIVNSIKEFHGIRFLSELVGTLEFKNWKPDRTVTWNEKLNNILLTEYPEELPIILRPSISSEYPSDWYIEDGSGRSVLFFRRLMEENSDNGFILGYIGHEPDKDSNWLNNNLDGFFINKYNEKRDYLDKINNN